MHTYQDLAKLIKSNSSSNSTHSPINNHSAVSKLWNWIKKHIIIDGGRSLISSLERTLTPTEVKTLEVHDNLAQSPQSNVLRSNLNSFNQMGVSYSLMGKLWDWTKTNVVIPGGQAVIDSLGESLSVPDVDTLEYSTRKLFSSNQSPTNEAINEDDSLLQEITSQRDKIHTEIGHLTQNRNFENSVERQIQYDQEIDFLSKELITLQNLEREWLEYNQTLTPIAQGPKYRSYNRPSPQLTNGISSTYHGPIAQGASWLLNLIGL